MERVRALKFNIDELIAKLSSSRDGLSDYEAKNRLAKFGPNNIRTEKHSSAISLFFRQFKNVLIYLLLLATIISFALKDFNDAIIILIILLINTGLGFYQAYNSEKAINSLSKLVNKEILVLRDKKEVLVNEHNIVIGDVVVLREGDIVPADIRLITANELSVNESLLTGETSAVYKNNSTNSSIVFCGSTIETGEAIGIVYAVSEQTELGKIAKLSNNTRKKTQFEQSLNSFSSFLIRITSITLLVIFIIKMIITHDFGHFGSLLLFIVALAIAVLPEAMPVIVTITLSKGAMQLAKKHVIARTLSSVEDLGNINILCSDKTGTITENKLKITNLVSNDKEQFQLFAASSLANLDEKRKKFQNSFDRAFIEFLPKHILDKAKSYDRLIEIPFDPRARRSRVVFSDGHKTYLLSVGSAETILSISNEADKNKYLKKIVSEGKNGLRHFGIAYKVIKYSPNEKFDISKYEKDLKFSGFVTLEDPLRSSTKNTIRLARELGIEIKILSGDSKEVTGYVASQVGLIANVDDVLIGDQIDKMNDTELGLEIKKYSVFARLSPEQKYRIINSLKSSGNIVGYQGDGINDAPSLKLAEVSIAVNNATDVARDSADILLLRNDLDVIINGIKYGRSIFININKYIRYTMISNFGAFFAIGVLYLLSSSLPLLTIQLILSALISSFPLISIATDNVDPRELTKPSKYNNKSLFFISTFLGMYTALFYLIYYALIRNSHVSSIQTSLYLFITLSNFIVILCVRNRDFFFKAPPLSRTLVLAFGAVSIATIALIYVHSIAKIFSFARLSMATTLEVIGACIVYLIFLDIVKVIFYKSKLGNE